MRWWLVVLAGCHVGYPPSVAMSINHSGAQIATPGSRIEVTTTWEKTCRRGSGPWLAATYEGGGTEAYSCDRVRHRVQLRCLEPCRITTPDGQTTAGEATWGPTRDWAKFVVEGLADTLEIEATFDHDGDRRVERLPLVRFVVPSDLAIKCGGHAHRWQACDRDLPADPDQGLQVDGPPGISVADIRIAGRETLNGYAPMNRIVPVGPDHRFVAGDYPVVIEAIPAPNTIRREIVLHVR